MSITVFIWRPADDALTQHILQVEVASLMWSW